VALTAFAAERRAAAWLMLTPAVQQSIDICWPVGPQQQTRSNSVLQPDGTDRQTDARPLQRPFCAYYAGSANNICWHFTAPKTSLKLLHKQLRSGGTKLR